MIIYLDSSALIKRYINESGSDEVKFWLSEAELLTTGLITRVEVVAAISRMNRLGKIGNEETKRTIDFFRNEWDDLLRLPVTEMTVERADRLAQVYGLRGYDAVHLATALIWKETSGRRLYLATYDLQLWKAGNDEGLLLLPEKHPSSIGGR